MRTIFFAAGLVLLSGWAMALEITDGYVRGMPPGQSTTAAFMELVNNGEQAVVIVGGSSPVANKVEIHEHRHEQGMMRMRKVERLALQPGQQIKLQPGAYHLMMFGLKKNLAEGDMVELTLQMEAGGEHTVTLPVYSVLNEKQRKTKESGDGR